MTGKFTSPSKGKTCEKTVIEDVEDEVDELPDSIFSKSAAIVFYEIDIGKAGVLP